MRPGDAATRPRDAPRDHDGTAAESVLRLISVPRIAQDTSGERHATWLELFFDLVFVVAVAALARFLHEDLTAAGLLAFVLLFVPVWWQWIDFSYFLDQFDTHDLLHKLVLFAVMFGVIALAIAIPGALHGGAVQFTLAMIALRTLMVWHYWRAWRNVPESHELTGRYLLSFSVALGVWLLSLAVPEPAKYAVWALAQAIEIANGPITYATIRHVPRQVSHMDERFGLFVIIVLGEAVVQVAAGIADVRWQGSGTVAAVSAFLLAACAWWLYFLRADASVIHRALRSDRHNLLLAYVYGYSHFFVFAGITAAAVGAEVAIHAAPGGQLPAGAGLVLSAGLAAYLFGVTALQYAAPRSLPRAVIAGRLATAALVGLVLPESAVLGPARALAGLAVAFVALTAWETLGANRTLG